MSNIPDLLRETAKRLEAANVGGAVICTVAAHEIEDLTRRLESEINARNNCMTALRGKDEAMSVLFQRLHDAGVDTSDLIP